MFVEESTVKTHLKSIYQKVGCANKTELLVLAMQAKLVLPEEAGKLNYIMCVIIFGTRFRVPFLFSSEISYFWGRKKKKRFVKYSCKMKSYVCLFAGMKGG